jgi:hypothetical protein
VAGSASGARIRAIHVAANKHAVTPSYTVTHRSANQAALLFIADKCFATADALHTIQFLSFSAIRWQFPIDK